MVLDHLALNKTSLDNLQSASAKIMLGFFPPSSSVTLFRLLLPAASWINLPTCKGNRSRVYSQRCRPAARSVNQLRPLNSLERLVSSKTGNAPVDRLKHEFYKHTGWISITGFWRKQQENKMMFQPVTASDVWWRSGSSSHKVCGWCFVSQVSEMEGGLVWNSSGVSGQKCWVFFFTLPLKPETFKNKLK